MSFAILKFDDLDENTLFDFKRAFLLCKKYNASTCFGLIGRSLEEPTSEYVDELHALLSEGVELWNHGYFHTEEEFSVGSYESQRYSIGKTQTLMEKHLGKAPATFGSPHNNSTEVTISVIGDNFPEIKNLLFMADGEGRININQLVLRCNYEIKTGLVDIDYFKSEYNRIKQYPYFVMQGHPSFWRDDDFERFEEILKILSADGNEFITAHKLYDENVTKSLLVFDNKWINSLSEFYSSHDKIFFYGAGEIGREVFKYSKYMGFVPDAFVVSDGHRQFSELCGVPVYEFSEVKNIQESFGIIPTIFGKSHEAVFNKPEFNELDIWSAGTLASYDEFIDYIRYSISIGQYE